MAFLLSRGSGAVQNGSEDHPEGRMLGLPPHMQYDGIQELGGHNPNPAEVYDYLTWLDDPAHPERFASAVEHTIITNLGFAACYIENQYDEQGAKIYGKQINIYSPLLRGNEDTHDHTRYADAGLIALPGDRQIISLYTPLDVNAPRFTELDVVEKRLVVINSEHIPGGTRDKYNFVPLGVRQLLRQSTTYAAAGSTKQFNSTEVHNVAMEWSLEYDNYRVALSLQTKKREQPSTVDTMNGLRVIKRFTEDEAEQVLAERETIRQRVKEPHHLSSAIATYVPPDRDILQLNNSMQGLPEKNPELAEILLRRAITTVGKIVKIAA